MYLRKNLQEVKYQNKVSDHFFIIMLITCLHSHINFESVCMLHCVCMCVCVVCVYVCLCVCLCVYACVCFCVCVFLVSVCF